MADVIGGLDKLRRDAVPAGYPGNLRTLYSPVDNVHGALLYLVRSAAKSLVVAMFGFDDQSIADVIKQKLADPGCFVQLTLDSSQAVGEHERAILAEESYPASSIAVGESEDGAIMHLKMVVIDGYITVTGSTNWSHSGQCQQDNALVVIVDPYVAAEASARISAIHADMLTQKRLEA